MRNLTREEARDRAAGLTVTSYDVAVDLTQGQTHFGSETVVRFEATAPSTFLELDGELLEATLDGRPLALVGNRIALDGLGGGHEVRVLARCAYTRTGEGLHRFVDPADGLAYVYMQAFLDDAQRVFACFDQPDLKAVYRLRVTAPDGAVVRSNTRGELVDGVHVFAQTAPLSTYMVSLISGPWHGVTQDHRGIELGLWCRASSAPHLDADELFAVTRDCLDFQEEAFGSPYAFGDSYDQVFCPEFNAGAMENPGLVTFTDELFVFRSRTTEGMRRLRAQVIAHEMAHMWFGNLVTMRWWDGIWLNESFAELMGHHTVDRALPWDGVWVDFCLGRKASGYRADQLPTTHPVAGHAPDSRAALLDFDGISYAKGASVLRQLVAFVGEDAFFAGLRAYLAEHAHGNTDLADLLRAVEASSGRDLSGWASSWLSTTGVSTLRGVWGPTVVVEQSGDVLRDHVVLLGVYDETPDGLVLRERVPVEVTGARTEVSALAGQPEPALLLVNDGDLTFAKLRFDARSLQTVLSSLSRLADPMARVLCWAALWDATRDADLPAASHVEAVIAHAAVEDDPSLVETLLGQALRAATAYAPRADRERLREALAQASWSTAVEPGSDLQLVRVRAAVSATSSASLLLGLLDGSGVPARLQVDSELRWHVVERAAALGLLDADAVGRELSADHTASGQLHAEAALAGMPDAAVKERTWLALTGGEATNAQARAMGSAFWQSDQDALLEPYVDRYVAEVIDLWERNSAQLAGSLAQHLLPSTLVRPDVVARLDALLGCDELPVGLRRVVLESRDDLARAVRCASMTRV